MTGKLQKLPMEFSKTERGIFTRASLEDSNEEEEKENFCILISPLNTLIMHILQPGVTIAATRD